MRTSIARLATWIRERTVILALATVGLAAAAGVAWVVIDLVRPPDFAAHGHQPYLEAQQRLHVQEARARLAVLANALAADRPSEDLAERVQRLHADLAWAVLPATDLARSWPDIAAELERLVEQIRGGDPDAGETLERVRALIVGSGGGS